MLDFTKIQDGPPIPEGYVDMFYGTAGFRGNANVPSKNLEHVAYRCGLLFPALPYISKEYFEKYSHYVTPDKTLGLGIVVTASHNPCSDNGIKLFSPTGHTLDIDWEPVFSSFINTRGSIQDAFSELFEKFENTPKTFNLKVLIGWDTRPSSQPLVSNISLGINSTFNLLGLEGSKVHRIGMVTSPSVPYLLSSRNTDVNDDEPYLSFMANSFLDILDKFQSLKLLNLADVPAGEHLYFDCSYGVGGYKVTRVFDSIRKLGMVPNLCTFHKYATDYDLNYKCGASYVHTTRYFPESLKRDFGLYYNKRFCCFDGDADRVLYFLPNDPVPNDEGEYNVLLLDGDRLLILKMMLLHLILKNSKKRLRVGVFQTRYSNGASFEFIKAITAIWTMENPNVTWHPEFFNTGIKNAERLSENYEISIYYETNGHGNIIFNKGLYSKGDVDTGTTSLSHQTTLTPREHNYTPTSNTQVTPTPRSSRDELYSALLIDFLNLFFPGGDGILNCLVHELAFKALHMDLYDCLDLYEDHPCLHDKLDLPGQFKSLFAASSSDESVLVEPKGLQEKIDAKVRKYPSCRAFLRPSGTEPLLRLYVEAQNPEALHEVRDHIFGLVHDFLDTFKSAV